MAADMFTIEVHTHKPTLLKRELDLAIMQAPSAIYTIKLMKDKVVIRCAEVHATVDWVQFCCQRILLLVDYKIFAPAGWSPPRA